MTWENLQKAALGLMFSNVSGTSAVTLSDASVAEYVLNMPDAANFAFADLSVVCPFVREVTLPLNQQAEQELDLNALCPGYLRILEPEILLYTNGTYLKFTDYMLHGSGKMRILTPQEGDLTLTFVCPPVYFTKDTPHETEIAYPEKALQAAAYYMAHRLYLEDDISIAMQYLNLYYTIKEELKTENDRTAYGIDSYTNKAGWL